MQPKVRFARPVLGKEELSAVHEVLRKAHRRPLTSGGRVIQFEEAFQDFVGGGRAVAVTSCMAALHLACLCLELGSGDEVICPALTHPATAHAIALTGAKPVFCDAHIESGNLDPDLLPALLTSRTKALSLVQFLGKPAYMMSCVDFARRHNLRIIEDCALALGASHSGRHVGLIGDVGCFSFYPAKHMTTGEGGMLLTNNPLLAAKAKRLRAFGYGDNRDADITEIGLNYRMTDMQGAIGLEQLKRVPGFLMRRRDNAAFLRRALKAIGLTEVLGTDYALSVLIPTRDRVKERFVSIGIETSIYYPRPVPYHPVYSGAGTFPVAGRICGEGLALSVGPHLDHGHMRLMADSLALVLGELDADCADRRGGLHRPPPRPRIEGARA
jgi:dTDP-4-amino-4,6-dideoxygalactose transaminase